MRQEQLLAMADVEQDHWWFVSRRRILQRLVDRLFPEIPEPLVVDIGCGPGRNLASLSNRCRCVGIDASPDAVRLARATFPDLHFIHGMAPDEVLGEIRQADLVLLMDVIEHVEDDCLLVSNIAATLKPGALMVVTVPADAKLWSPHDEAVLHYRRYDLPRLEAVWRGLPLETRLVAGLNRRLYWPIRAARAVTRRRDRSVGASGTDFKLPPKPLNRLFSYLFSKEIDRLVAALDSGVPSKTSHSVSLIAILERRVGEVEIRSKPTSLAADVFAPPAFR